MIVLYNFLWLFSAAVTATAKGQLVENEGQLVGNEQSRKPYRRVTETTSTNLGWSHRLPHVCSIMLYGKLGGYRLQETATFQEIYIHRNQRPIWVSLVWILEKYNDITLTRGTANLGRSHRLPCVFNNVY